MTLQITQFVVGYTFGFIYLFIHYDFPASLRTYHESPDITRLKAISFYQMMLDQDEPGEATPANRYLTVSCLTHSSHVFLLLLGSLYLLPLTYMFSRLVLKNIWTQKYPWPQESSFRLGKIDRFKRSWDNRNVQVIIANIFEHMLFLARLTVYEHILQEI